jgi:hypothetical protein
VVVSVEKVDNRRLRRKVAPTLEEVFDPVDQMTVTTCFLEAEPLGSLGNAQKGSVTITQLG